MTLGLCPVCTGAFSSSDDETWVCASCRTVMARPAALKAAAEEELPFVRRAAADDPGPVVLPRGPCPRCRADLALMDDDPWSMCPSCRVRIVPRLALSRIARDPRLADRTPIGIPSDDVLHETSHSRVFRMAIIAFLFLCAGMTFKLPSVAMEECREVINDPTTMMTKRRHACEFWIWRDIIAGALVVGAIGLGLTLRRTGTDRRAPRGRELSP